MSDFAAQDLVDAASKVFGEAQLRDRVAPRGDKTAKDRELLRIASSVVSAFAGAAGQSVGWPLPGLWPPLSADADGNDISGRPYREVWPANMLQKALEIFNARTYMALEVVPDQMRRTVTAVEKWLFDFARGSVALSIGGDTDTSSPSPESTHDRQGHNLLADGAADHDLLLDQFRGLGWDSA